MYKNFGTLNRSARKTALNKRKKSIHFLNYKNIAHKLYFDSGTKNLFTLQKINAKFKIRAVAREFVRVS